jgi:hypothetical protein
MNRIRLFLILGASGIFTVLMLGGMFWAFSHGKKSARETSERFAAALVAHDAHAAPRGAAEYVNTIRSHFGAVSAARVISTWTDTSGRSDHPVSDVWIETAKGPAVVELEFNGTVNAKSVRWLQEIAPADVPDDALSDTEFVALAKAFDARGGRPATSLNISRSLPAVVEVPAAKKATRRKNIIPPAARTQLKCVKRAKGDVKKLSRCATL